MSPAMRACALLLLSCAAAGAAAQQQIDPPVLKPFADNHDWLLVDDVVYRPGNADTAITVPRGFVTDFASIPQLLWSAELSPNGRYSKAAIVHDYLYWSQLCSREQADNLLDIAMQESDVGYFQRSTIYWGVRMGGDAAWQANATQRAQGLPRVVPAGAFGFGPNVVWKDYRGTLPVVPMVNIAAATPPAYCALGDTRDVPGRPR